MVQAIHESQHTYAIAELLGAVEVDDPDAEAQQLLDQGLQLIQAELARRDIRFDPRFGISARRHAEGRHRLALGAGQGARVRPGGAPGHAAVPA